MQEEYNIKKATIARTVILALALINQFLSISGHPVIPISDENIESFVSSAWSAVMAVITWWYNNSFTKAAIKGDMVKDEMKKREKE